MEEKPAERKPREIVDASRSRRCLWVLRPSRRGKLLARPPAAPASQAWSSTNRLGGRRPEGARKPNRKPTRKPPENLPKTSFAPHPNGTSPLSKTNSNQVFERYSGWFSGGFRGGFRAGFRGGFRGGSGGGIREVFVRFPAWFSWGGAVQAWWATLRGLAPAGLPVAKPLAVAVQNIFAASVLQAFLPR